MMKVAARVVIAILIFMLVMGMLPAIPYIANSDHVNAGVWVTLTIKAIVIFGLWKLYRFLSATSSPQGKTYYDLLGVRSDAPEVVIRAAYKAMAHQHHPDRGGSTAMMQRLNEAHDTLTNAPARKQYDAAIGSGADISTKSVSDFVSKIIHNKHVRDESNWTVAFGIFMLYRWWSADSAEQPRPGGNIAISDTDVWLVVISVLTVASLTLALSRSVPEKIRRTFYLSTISCIVTFIIVAILTF